VSEKVPDDSKSQQISAPDVKQDGDESAPSAEPGTEETAAASPAPKAWATPKLWTGLFNPATATAPGTKNDTQTALLPGFGKTNAETLAEALRSFNAVSDSSRVTFLEPRGLINTGNMCYMNSVCCCPPLYYRLLTYVQVLQVLVFCAPFYNFLDQVGKSAAHSFKSETPLIDAM
jgi:ubiquitin carboxyl-terminal hydrolase 10